MSLADKIFVSMCQDILDNGMSTEGQEVRAKWEDGTPAYTIKKFGIINRYDLSKEFPALTLRKTAIKSAFNELCWIWLKKSNDIRQLDSKIWNQWARSDHTIGSAYGFQFQKLYPFKDITSTGLANAFGTADVIIKESIINSRPTSFIPMIKDSILVEPIIIYDRTTDIFYMDQVNRVIYDLKNNPFSRRIMTNLYNFNDLWDMALYPCAYSMTFNVTKDSEGNLVLNGILNQRSQDVLVANNWNVVQYALLIHMLAQVCGMKVGELVHVIADAHIYDRHIPLIKELISREQYPAPNVILDTHIDDFYMFTDDDLIIQDYQHGKQLENIPVAI